MFVGDRSFRHALDGATCTIGRAADCNLQIDDASVSRRHAVVRLGSSGASIEDLGSHNGTRVNGATIHDATPVVGGDLISIGEATCLLQLPARPWSGELDLHILSRLESELDRARRYDRRVAILLWTIDAPLEGVVPLIAPLVRRCDAVGALRDHELLGVFPELDLDEATTIAERGLESIRPITGARVGIAAYPQDGRDATSLLDAARDALAGAERIGRAEAAIQHLAVGESSILVADRVMARTYELVRKLARSELPTLVVGETGTGKELVARALHEWSTRASSPFVAVNCAALPESLVESELFGHKRGAFTGADRDRAGLFEAASGGTLFFDEIGELPLSAQAKLLRAVETRTVTRIGEPMPIAVDVRFVAATNRDLAAEVAAGRFRQDLFYRLGAALVTLPPLRERPRDLVALARAFLSRACGRLGIAPLRLSEATLRALSAHAFPGNIRELGNTIEYAAAVVAGDADRDAHETTIEPWHLPSSNVAGADPGAGSGFRMRSIAEEVEELERRRMSEALAAASGNQSRAAEIIGMPRRTFVTKLGKYGLR
ncbi:MAG: sigma 54-interacting transcriptional regulator [Deltaproteobacteria bacterium]|nr:sigma 54-interacting transcriptional regulator [Kofleriaceae bacterium]